jgi:tetratricopeptide (TPR) repeat protein
MQCGTAVRKVGYFGKEAEAGYRLCEQALDIDPDNVFALTMLATKFFLPVMLRRSADPQADLTRAAELVSRALTIDSNYSFAHDQKGQVLRAGRRFEDAIVEYERALALDPNNALAYASMGETYNEIGHYEKAIDLLDKAIRRSPLIQVCFIGITSKVTPILPYDRTMRRSSGRAGLSPSIRIGALRVLS